jgi:carboxylesterase
VVEELRGLKLRHKKVILVGHSMGGALSTLAVSELGADGLVLGGAYFGVTHRWYYGLRPETWTKVSARVLPWVYKGKLFIQVNDKSAKEHITSYTWIPAKAAVTLSKIGERVNDPQVLQKVTCPVLMLHAQGDIAASPEASERALNAMASTDKQLVWLERSNHHVFWDYDRELVATEVLAFVKRIGAGPTSTAAE